MKQLLEGNEAIAKGALAAGMGFFAGYPITPSSEILNGLIRSKAKVFQLEDEIASINACIGASLAGLKAMTATSGPGFSLMQEAIGFAHMVEVPMVIVNSQRVGPATGMPTMPAQGDILQSRFGSHGDYFPIVFYPNSVAELYKYTIAAFNAAEESLSPVILLSDAFLSRLYETVQLEKFETVKRDRKPLGEGIRHFTGLTSLEGIPKPSDTDVHRAIIANLEKKQKAVAKKYEAYEFIENKSSRSLIIAYGATSRLAYYFKDRYSILRPIRMFPVMDSAIRDIGKNYDEVIVIEMNAGQYKREIERILRRDVRLISLLGGRLSLGELKRKLA